MAEQERRVLSELMCGNPTCPAIGHGSARVIARANLPEGAVVEIKCPRCGRRTTVRVDRGRLLYQCRC